MILLQMQMIVTFKLYLARWIFIQWVNKAAFFLPASCGRKMLLTKMGKGTIKGLTLLGG